MQYFPCKPTVETEQHSGYLGGALCNEGRPAGRPSHPNPTAAFAHYLNQYSEPSFVRPMKP